MNLPRLWLMLGALGGGLAVTLGAFGAHGLESALEKDTALSISERGHLLDVWETAARYQMYHALALLAVGLLALRHSRGSLHVAGAAMVLGTLIFSGCLYALVLTRVPALGKFVPVGGILLIVGWLSLLVGVLQFGESEQAAGGKSS